MGTKKAFICKTSGKPATAFHGSSDDGTTHVVGIGNLRVMITHDNGAWFAQGLEVDYAAQGETLEQVKSYFTKGLAATIDEHLKIFGHIEKLLIPAPPETWAELYKNFFDGLFSITQVSVHIHQALPVDEVLYFEQAA